MASRGWTGVDLDGTLAFYDQWVGETHVGEPIWPMMHRVARWLREGREVRIMTARVWPGVDGQRDVSAIRTAIQDWTEAHLGKRLEVTCMKDFQMIELWDDRAIQVITNTGIAVLAPDGSAG